MGPGGEAPSPSLQAGWLRPWAPVPPYPGEQPLGRIRPLSEGAKSQKADDPASKPPQAQKGPTERGGESAVTCSVPLSQSPQTQERILKSSIWLCSALSALAGGLQMAIQGPRNHHVFCFVLCFVFFCFVLRRSIASLRFSNRETLSPISNNKLT